MTESRPDVLLIVLDCVRARELAEGSPGAVEMPHLRSILREAVTFDHAVTPAPWTVPSHASLLTGLYPWEHGLHAHGHPAPGAWPPTVTAQLRSAGYRTLCLSANPHLNDRTGLARDFEAAAWGAPWEQYVRHLRPQRRTGVLRRAPGPTRGARVVDRIKGSTVLRRAAQWPLRHSTAVDVTNELLYRLRRTPGSCEWCVAPWIEPALREWLSGLRPEESGFVLVNLMEAHEPYLWPASMRRAPGGAGPLRVRQDQSSWVLGEWAPAPAEHRRLERLYRAAVGALDHRIGGIVQALREAGRWEGCTVIITGDHGQTFGAGGLLMHGLGLEEDLLRVPLILRAPGRGPEGERRSTWSSLVDVAPTILELTGCSGAAPPTSGASLVTLAKQARTAPVWSVCDGLFGNWERSRIAPERRAQLDRIQVAAYQGGRKTVYDAATQTTVRAELAEDPGDPGRAAGPAASDLLLESAFVAEARRIVQALAPGAEIPHGTGPS